MLKVVRVSVVILAAGAIHTEWIKYANAAGDVPGRGARIPAESGCAGAGG